MCIRDRNDGIHTAGRVYSHLGAANHTAGRVNICSGAGSISKVEGAKRWKHFFYCAPSNFFVVPPMTGHYRKVQGTVTRTELGQSWLTLRGQSNL